MPYPQQFLKVVASGTTYPGEIWSCSWNIAQNFEGPVEQPTDLTPYVTALSTWHQAADTQLSGPGRLDMVKVNLIGTDGLYVNDDTQFVEVVPGVPTTNVSLFAPAQCTVCVSLTTNKSRGLAHGGRFYPPVCLPGLGADGRITSANAQKIASSAATLISDLNAIGPGDVSIMSNVGAGAREPVRGVRVGRVVDTQRRRRNALPEEYVVSAVNVVVTPTP